MHAKQRGFQAQPSRLGFFLCHSRGLRGLVFFAERGL